MTSRPYTVLGALIGEVCVYTLVHLLFSGQTRSLPTYLVQGVLIGCGLSLVTAQVLARIRAVNVNGWMTMLRCGVPGNGMFMRAASSMMSLGPVNVPQEASGGTIHQAGTRINPGGGSNAVARPFRRLPLHHTNAR